MNRHRSNDTHQCHKRLKRPLHYYMCNDVWYELIQWTPLNFTIQYRNVCKFMNDIIIAYFDQGVCKFAPVYFMGDTKYWSAFKNPNSNPCKSYKSMGKLRDYCDQKPFLGFQFAGIKERADHLNTYGLKEIKYDITKHKIPKNIMKWITMFFSNSLCSYHSTYRSFTKHVSVICKRIGIHKLNLWLSNINSCTHDLFTGNLEHLYKSKYFKSIFIHVQYGKVNVNDEMKSIVPVKIHINNNSDNIPPLILTSSIGNIKIYKQTV
jgi:hypothetical protein